MISKTGRNTTVAAIGLVLYIVGESLKAQFDGDPSTNWNVNEVVTGLIAAFGLFKARDDGNGSAAK